MRSVLFNNVFYRQKGTSAANSAAASKGLLLKTSGFLTRHDLKSEFT
jgi:hypothetical protein